MHHSVPVAQMGLLPSMYPFCVPPSPLQFDLGPQITPPHPHRGDFSTWELRCLRKQRRRDDAEVCSAKRRRLMQTDGEHWDTCAPHSSVEELGVDSCSSVVPPPDFPLTCSVPTHTSPVQPTPDSHSSCMEVEAAQRRLREIEDRITLEDDSDSDLDLEVEVCPRRPVLVLSDSLKEGLQRGLSDILPHTVAQSVSHSCMELVLWRPPDAPFSHCLKDCVQKPRKQQSGPRQPPTPCPSPSPHTDPPSPPYSCPGAPGGSGDEEDMEM